MVINDMSAVQDITNKARRCAWTPTLVP